MPLTDVAIRNAAVPPRPKKLGDGEGLYLHLQPNGSKIWRMSFRLEGKQNTITFGAYPELTIAKARKARDQAKEKIEAGIDPVVQRAQERDRERFTSGDTFEEVGKEWQAKRKREKLSESAYRKDVQMLDFHAYPVLGRRPITTITAPEILALLRRLEERGKHETAHRLRSTISRVFRYSIATGRCERDPAADLKGALVAHRHVHHAALFEPKAIGGLMRAIHGYDGQSVTRLAMLILAHVFLRPGELRLGQWSEIDWEAKQWIIPEARMKMRKKLIVPLSPQVERYLKQLQKLNGQGTFMFPSVLGGRRPISDGTINAALRRLGYTKDQMVGHGFRRTASTILNESGLWKPDAIERQLAHVDGSVRGIYSAAQYLEERTRMMTWYSDWLDQVAAKKD